MTVFAIEAVGSIDYIILLMETRLFSFANFLKTQMEYLLSL